MVHIAELTICLDEKLTNVIYKSLLPDNVDLPESLSIHMAIYGSCLNIKVECGRSLASLLNTLDDILSSIQIAVKSIGSSR
ncbi:MAG: KEOPS complex subunit Pcc1 [archaeon GB-1845-036]|nr:hypothetical protein [Candidatus Verstraetearchaeota archaeon]MCS7373499.1 KEOPS complex subunit Pcc1 [Candidatus Culexmicrobium thermophilum]RLE55542.1 MAG: hypothetical protein DRJ30_03570 [Candidatus Verstraetearchaeota archaeon]HDO21166.1 hypothetical protein [Candidatus Bathyarchaeota archaeon]